MCRPSDYPPYAAGGATWRLRELTRCPRCGGRGSYVTGYGAERRPVVCTVCDGTGKVPPLHR